MLNVPTAIALTVSLTSASALAAPQNVDPSRSRQSQPRSGQGSGTALDANLLRGSGGQNVTTPNEDLAARNLIVTGNVVGGRGFRGSVGYSAPGDFRGVAGSDASFGFRADSALSSLDFLSGTRSGDRFALAQQYAILSYRRDTTAPNEAASSGEIPGLFRLDRASSQLNAARAIDLSSEPIGFASAIDRNQRPIELTVSPILGVRMRRLDDPLATAPLTSFERARAREDIVSGRLNPAEPIRLFDGPLTAAETARTDALIQPRQPFARTDALVETSRIDATPIDPRSAYDDIVRSLVERYADDPTVRVDAETRSLERARRDLGIVRELLTGTKPLEGTTQPALPGTGAGTAPFDPTMPPPPDLPNVVDPLAPPTKSDDLDPEAARERLNELARALRHGTQVRDLTAGERVRVDELVLDGQDALLRGDYFRAEKRFESALDLNPGNPLLIAGLANSQLGAGVYLAAANTLRALFATNPEMIDVRYEARLLPNETRLRLAEDTLRQRIALDTDRPRYGFVLAYLGHQLSRRGTVEEGLSVMGGSPEWDAMRDLLRAVWLGETASGSPSSGP